jgi:hypothetical protein
MKKLQFAPSVLPTPKFAHAGEPPDSSSSRDDSELEPSASEALEESEGWPPCSLLPQLVSHSNVRLHSPDSICTDMENLLCSPALQHSNPTPQHCNKLCLRDIWWACNKTTKRSQSCYTRADHVHVEAEESDYHQGAISAQQEGVVASDASQTLLPLPAQDGDEVTRETQRPSMMSARAWAKIKTSITKVTDRCAG